METKICSICKNEKLLSDFYSKSSIHHIPFDRCKKCFNSYCSKRWTQKKIDAIIYKGSKCMDCDASYPKEPYVIFDFHHLDPSKKDFQWNKLRLRSDSSIKKELEKCDLLCSNCHRNDIILITSDPDSIVTGKH